MNTRDVQNALRALGWPIAADGAYGQQTTNAVHDFQRGFAFRDLLIDGHAGPATWAGLDESVNRGGRCGEFFKFSEFRSPGDKWIKVNRVQVRSLDELRRHVGPVRVVSGYRDPRYNQQIPGAAKNSQHLYGNATDVEQKWSLNLIRNLRRFSGIGVVKASGLVAHVDSRHDGPRTTPGTPDNPTVWYYA